MSKKYVTPQNHRPDIPLNEYYTTPSDDFNVKVSERLTALEHDQKHQQEAIDEIKQHQANQEERLQAIEEHVKSCRLLTKVFIGIGSIIAVITTYCLNAFDLLDRIKHFFSSGD